MSFVAVGVGAGTAVAGVAGSAISAGAAGSAADKQAAASNYAADLQKQIFDQQRQDTTPWRTAGLSSLYGQGGLFVGANGQSGVPMTEEAQKRAFIQERMKAYENMRGTANEPDWLKNGNADTLKYEAETDWNGWGKNSPAYQSANQYQLDPSLTKAFSMEDFQKDPGYDFRMQEGQKALERSAAAKGGLQSGGFMKALTKYGQDYASNEYQNAYNRFNNDQANRFNRLASIAGIGQTATGQLGQAGQNYANQVGNIATSNANAQGAAGIAAGNAWSQGLNSIAGAGKTWMDYTMANKYMKGLGIE